MSGKSYFEIEIAFNESNYNSIYNELYLCGIISIIEENGVIKACLPEEQLNILDEIRGNLIQNKIVKNHSIYISPFENKDWNKEWEKTIEPVFIKNKIIIYPSWKKESLTETAGKILIEIDPKMSFGTGHNETTQLILELMVDYIDINDKFMLDFGCGTAILAITGVKLGADKAIAIDIDEDSIENAKEYIKLNNVEDKIILHKTDLIDLINDNFDVICANITSGVIIPNMKNIYNKLKPGGKLFITGILTEEKSTLLEELKNNGFKTETIRDKAEWTGVMALT